MNIKLSLRSFGLFTALLILTACQSLGVSAPKTFNERLTAGYATVTSVRQIGTSLVSSGKISPDDARNIQSQADNARAGLDIARSLGEVNGADKLGATLTILTALQKYVAEKGK